MKKLAEAIFGIFDGMTSVWGVIIALLGKGNHAILIGTTGLAIASAIGMGMGEYLADNTEGVPEALTMGLATAVGTLAPILPFLFIHGVAAIVAACIISVLLTLLIGKVRRKGLRGYVTSLVTLAIAGGATATFTLLTGNGG